MAIGRKKEKVERCSLLRKQCKSGMIGACQVTMSAFIVDIRKIKDTQQGKQIWPYRPQYIFGQIFQKLIPH